MRVMTAKLIGSAVLRSAYKKKSFHLKLACDTTCAMSDAPLSAGLLMACDGNNDCKVDKISLGDPKDATGYHHMSVLLCLL